MTITKCLCAVGLGHTFRLERYLVELVSVVSVRQNGLPFSVLRSGGHFTPVWHISDLQRSRLDGINSALS